MSKQKIIWGNRIKKLLDKIKKSNLVRLLKSKSIIKNLESKIDEITKEKQQLIDRNRLLALENKKFDKQEKKSNEYKKEIKNLKALIESSKNMIYKLTTLLEQLENQLFETNQELVRYKIQCEEYENQIRDYRTEGRYLVKKVKSGRTPNTVKTKVSKPMSARVTKYMREEHE